MSRGGHRGFARPANDLSGTAPNLERVVGEYWACPAVRSTLATTAGVLYTKRILAIEDAPIDRIGAMVTAGSVGSTVTLGVYEDDGTSNAPGALLFDAGTIDGNSATAQEIVIAQTLRGGRYYWLAALAAGGTPTVRTDGSSSDSRVGRHATLATATGTTLVHQGRFRSGVVGTALPNPAATTTLLTVMPTIALRIA